MIRQQDAVRRHIVTAAIVDLERRLLLLAQRAHTTSYGGLWATPGGAIAFGETHGLALRRELHEELGVRWTTTDHLDNQFLQVYEHVMPSSRTGELMHITCLLVDAREIVGVPQCCDKTIGVGWFGAAMLAYLPLAAADNTHRRALVDLIRGAA